MIALFKVLICNRSLTNITNIVISVYLSRSDVNPCFEKMKFSPIKMQFVTHGQTNKWGKIFSEFIASNKNQM